MFESAMMIPSISRGEARQNFLRSPENLSQVRAMVDNLCPMPRTLINNNSLNHLKNYDEVCASKLSGHHTEHGCSTSPPLHPPSVYPYKHSPSVCHDSGSKVAPYTIDAILGLGAGLRGRIAGIESGITDGYTRKAPEINDGKDDVTSHTHQGGSEVNHADVTSTTGNAFSSGNGMYIVWWKDEDGNILFTNELCIRVIMHSTLAYEWLNI